MDLFVVDDDDNWQDHVNNGVYCHVSVCKPVLSNPPQTNYRWHTDDSSAYYYGTYDSLKNITLTVTLQDVRLDVLA